MKITRYYINFFLFIFKIDMSALLMRIIEISVEKRRRKSEFDFKRIVDMRQSQFNFTQRRTFYK